jgi:hypothetical protein
MPRRPLLVILVSIALQACQMLGGGDEPGPDRGRHEQYPAAHNVNADCERLSAYVVNADGSLARPDLENGLKGEFKKWDKSGDGQLSQAETQPLNDHLRSLHVNASPVMDWNGDGHVTYDEFASGWRTMFDLCARGDSDVVTKADLERSPSVPAPSKTDEEKSPGGASFSPAF